MIYFLYGDNDYLIGKRVDELKNMFATKYDASNVSTVDVNEISSVNLMAQLTAASLFTEHQMIIVKAITSSSECWTALGDNIQYIPDETVAVFTHVKTLSKVSNIAITKTYKTLKAGGVKMEKLDATKPWEIDKWLAGEAKRRGLDVDKAAIAKMVELTAGEDNQQARLAIELDKLELLVKSKVVPEITSGAVEEYIEPSLQTNAFAIFGAAVEGDTKKAIALLRQLRDSGEDINRFLGLLASQELALATVITGAKTSSTTYQLQQASNIARAMGDKTAQLAKLRNVAATLADLDAKIKSSKPEEAWVYAEIALASLAM